MNNPFIPANKFIQQGPIFSRLLHALRYLIILKMRCQEKNRQSGSPKAQTLRPCPEGRVFRPNRPGGRLWYREPQSLVRISRRQANFKRRPEYPFF